jgi:hypothetical protein
MIAPQGLSTDQQMEYEQISEFARHDDIVDLTVSGLLLPLLAAALAGAWHDHQFALPLAFGSFFVCCIGIRSSSAAWRSFFFGWNAPASLNRLQDSITTAESFELTELDGPGSILQV